jgi:hypothetical protein
MLAQDLPDDVKEFRAHMENGLVEPVIGGFGGHRMLYFGKSTNEQAIQYGIDVIQNILGSCGSVFHPNSRLYAETPNIDEAILEPKIKNLLRVEVDESARRGFDEDVRHDGKRQSIKFVVIDQSAFKDRWLSRNTEGLWHRYEHTYIWRQQCKNHRGPNQPCEIQCPTWYWLFIDGDMKDTLFSASENEWRAGKLFINLRKHLFYGVSRPEIVEKAIQVYGDDADKTAGNGWFDGDYNGVENNYPAIFAAALEWIAAHPWLKAVTAAELDAESECVGTIHVPDAIDPSIHGQPGWLGRWKYQGEDKVDAWSKDQITDLYKEQGLPFGFEYARWYRKWRETMAAWLGLPMGTIGDELERAIMVRQGDRSENELDVLGRLAFLVAIHEAHWSKKPLESYAQRSDFDKQQCEANALPAYWRLEEGEPENFVLCSTLQMRNAHVFRCAARWADLARGRTGDARILDGKTRKPTSEAPSGDDPLVAEIVSMRQRSGPWFGESGQPRGLRWDLDVTDNVLLYNDEVLVVLDRNGGRITHIFALRNGPAGQEEREPVVVSGNIKAYQFLGDESAYGGPLNCNGEVVQGTVFVPNHRYVASDIDQSRPRIGAWYNPKTKVSTFRCGGSDKRVEDGKFGKEDWVFPDNFNCYGRREKDERGDSVVWEYPGLAWDMDPAQWSADKEGNGDFHAALARYRTFVESNGADYGGVAPRPQPPSGSFTKTIRLRGRKIEIEYAGDVRRRHRVANEFSLDLLRMVMHGSKQMRSRHVVEDGRSRLESAGLAQINGIELSSADGDLSVMVRLKRNCRFSDETLEGSANRRLHRAFSDCLEIESVEDGRFAYEIELRLGARRQRSAERAMTRRRARPSTADG